MSHVTENSIADDDIDPEISCILYFVSEVSHVTEDHIADDDDNHAEMSHVHFVSEVSRTILLMIIKIRGYHAFCT